MRSVEGDGFAFLHSDTLAAGSITVLCEGMAAYKILSCLQVKLYLHCLC